MKLWRAVEKTSANITFWRTAKQTFTNGISADQGGYFHPGFTKKLIKLIESPHNPHWSKEGKGRIIKEKKNYKNDKIYKV